MTTRKQRWFRFYAACLIPGLFWCGACTSETPSDGQQIERVEDNPATTGETEGVGETEAPVSGADNPAENVAVVPDEPEVSVDGRTLVLAMPEEDNSAGLLQRHSSLLGLPVVADPVREAVPVVETPSVGEADDTLGGDSLLPFAGGPQQPGPAGLRFLDGDEISFSQILPTPSLNPWVNMEKRAESGDDPRSDKRNESLSGGGTVESPGILELSELDKPGFPLLSEAVAQETPAPGQQVFSYYPNYPLVPVITNKNGFCGRTSRTTMTPYVLIPPGQPLWGAAPFYGAQAAAVPAMVPAYSYYPQGAAPPVMGAPRPHGLPGTTSFAPIPPIVSVPPPTPPGALAKYPLQRRHGQPRPYPGVIPGTTVIYTTAIPLPPTIIVTPPQAY